MNLFKKTVNLVIYAMICEKSCVDCQEERVVGGSSASPGMFPYMAFIVQKATGECSGALISPEWILTAAHCVKGGVEAAEVRAGDSAKTGRNVQVRKSEQIIVHPKYEHMQFAKYDYALIKVRQFNMSSNTIGVLKLFDWKKTPDLKNCTVHGWGISNLETTKGADVLQHLQVTARQKCPCVWSGREAKSLLCLNSQEGKSTCKGDSGSPLVCAGKGLGVLHAQLANDCKSKPKDCTDPKSTKFFMSTCPQLEWIKKHVKTKDIPSSPKQCKMVVHQPFSQGKAARLCHGSSLISLLIPITYFLFEIK